MARGNFLPQNTERCEMWRQKKRVSMVKSQGKRSHMQVGGSSICSFAVFQVFSTLPHISCDFKNPVLLFRRLKFVLFKCTVQSWSAPAWVVVLDSPTWTRVRAIRSDYSLRYISWSQIEKSTDAIWQRVWQLSTVADCNRLHSGKVLNKCHFFNTTFLVIAWFAGAFILYSFKSSQL